MSDLVARLIEVGTPANLVAEVAMMVARAEVNREAIERRRSADRERQAARRHVTSRDTADVTDAPPVLDKEKSPTPPKEINPTPRASNTRAKPDTRLPGDWQPEPLTPGSTAFQIVAAWQPGRLERELAKFRDHYAAAPAAKGLARDWQAKWRTWIGNADGFGGHGAARNGTHSMAGNGRGASASGHGRTVDAALRAVALAGGPH